MEIERGRLVFIPTEKQWGVVLSVTPGKDCVSVRLGSMNHPAKTFSKEELMLSSVLLEDKENIEMKPIPSILRENLVELMTTFASWMANFQTSCGRLMELKQDK